MCVNDAVFEKVVVSDIVRHLPRRSAIDSPSDVELVDFDQAAPHFLAVSSDSLCEEVATGLYSDPYTVGWMLVTATLSDLAAATFTYRDILGLAVQGGEILQDRGLQVCFVGAGDYILNVVEEYPLFYEPTREFIL